MAYSIFRILGYPTVVLTDNDTDREQQTGSPSIKEIEQPAEIAEMLDNKTPEHKINENSPIVYICAPYRGNNMNERRLNVIRAKMYGRYALEQGCVPFIPHLAICGFLDEDKPEERTLGILADTCILNRCDEMWVFQKPSEGMKHEIKAFTTTGKPIRYFTFEE